MMVKRNDEGVGTLDLKKIGNLIEYLCNIEVLHIYEDYIMIRKSSTHKMASHHSLSINDPFCLSLYLVFVVNIPSIDSERKQPCKKR